jgi:hypothetical protein
MFDRMSAGALTHLNFEDGLVISLERTLRIPDDGTDHALPPSLGEFPLYRVSDYASRVPAHWLKTKGDNYFFPLYQREAMWISFHGDYYRPYAIKVGAGNIDALTGKIWDDDMEARRRLSAKKQNYLVVPTQHWLDGFKAGKGYIKQFVAMPLGMGYTVEGQLTGSEDFGGLQFVLIKAHADKLPKRPAYDSSRILRGGMVADGASWHAVGEPIYGAMMKKSATSSSSHRLSLSRSREMAVSSMAEMTVSAAPEGMEMGLGMGGKMTQVVNHDPYGFEVWNQEDYKLVNIWIVNSMMFREITGQEPPSTPVSAQAYSQHGYPWFTLYDEKMPDLKPGKPLKGVKSVKEMDKAKGFGPQQDDSSIKLTPEQIVHIPKPGSNVVAEEKRKKDEGKPKKKNGKGKKKKAKVE